MFSQLTSDKIISVHNVSEIYKVPLLLKSQNVAEIISNKLLMYLPKVFVVCFGYMYAAECMCV